MLRRRTGLPKHVAQYPPRFVDRRHTAGTQGDAAPPHGTDGLEVSVEYYRDHPP